LTGKLNRHKRHGMIFEHNDFQAVGEHAIDERRGLASGGGGRALCRRLPLPCDERGLGARTGERDNRRCADYQRSDKRDA
jgi:hypothetical protein